MVRKIFLFILTFIYILYAYAIATNNDLIGDIFSPILMLVISGYVYHGFVRKQKDRALKWSGWFITLGVLVWFICDLWWGIQTLFLHTDPEENFITVYGYSLTNLFLFITVLITGFESFKKINKIQALLDTSIVAIYVSVLLWLFAFEQSREKVLLLWTDPISMASILTDIINYSWFNVWIFSTRFSRPSLAYRLLVMGGVVYAITDFIYYYMYFYTKYEANSWVDGAYMVAFSLMAFAGYKKDENIPAFLPKKPLNQEYYKLGMEVLIILVPVIVLVFKRDQIQYFILLIVSLLIYYILISFTQKSIFQEKLLELERMNVSELEIKVAERTEEIFRILNTDFVTGLYSRRYFELNLSEMIENVSENEKVALLYINQNESKTIKYLYGKDTSENLLKEAAETISQLVSAENRIFASYGDDIFVLMIKGHFADTEAKKTAKQIINRCNDIFFVDNHAIRITLNIGISCYPLDTSNANDLIKNADIAMMQSRAKGFNQIQLYNEQIGNLTYSRNKIELKLQKVVYDEGFVLYYQPQVYCKTGKLCGFEALIRWFEGNNLISPLAFIPVAEETGVIVPLGYWIIESAARQHAVWKAVTGRDIRVSINVSPKQLVEIDFVQRLHDILKKYNVSPETFEIEITESQQVENSVYISETLSEIKKIGISIAIDDFGTGYSSLFYIKNIPTDRIKIAKELIDNIENDIYSNSIVQMAISIAKVKGIKVIAEGVETKEQWECLKELGCDEIQGYYFSKPLPVDQIGERWLGN